MLIAEEVPTLECKNSRSRNVVDIPPMQVFCIGENGKTSVIHLTSSAKEL